MTILEEAELEAAKRRIDGALSCIRHRALDRAVELIEEARAALADAAQRLRRTGA